MEQRVHHRLQSRLHHLLRNPIRHGWYAQLPFESQKKGVFGYPDWDFISTSYVERLNATTRLHMKRLAGLTHAFSKKRENFEAAVGLHFAYYNFVRRHNTLRCNRWRRAVVLERGRFS